MISWNFSTYIVKKRLTWCSEEKLDGENPTNVYLRSVAKQLDGGNPANLPGPANELLSIQPLL
jgi:hypothetical protein